MGTHDVSVLDFGGGVFEVKSTRGDTHLGGDDVDELLINFLADDFKSNTGIDLRKDPMALQRLKEAAEKAKIELSSNSATDINLPYITVVDGVPQHLTMNLTRSKFDALIDNFVTKCMDVCKQAVKDAGLSVDQIDEVILVGGSTRIPKIQKAVEDYFGKPASKGVNPDEVVAIGAAIQGAVLTGEVKDVLLLDVIPLSLGIETLGGVMTKLIDANTTIPTTKEQIFSTAADNQPEVEIHVLQGERPLAKDNKTIGRFNLNGIPPAPKGCPQIEVKFDIDANGILNVTASDKATGKKQNIRIEASSGLSKDEIEKMKADAAAHAEADKLEREKIDIKNNAENALFASEKNIKEYGEKMSAENKTNIETVSQSLKSAIDSNDSESMKAATDALNEAWQKASSEMYAAQQNQQQSTEQTETADNNQDQTEAEDVNYEEVK